MNYSFLRFPEGKSKAVTFSYDDAPRYDLHLLEIMDKYNIKCTLNVNNSVLNEEKRTSKLTPAEIRKFILEKGHEIAVHCATHKAPGKIRAIDGIREVLENRLALEKEFGGIIRGMAYPDSGITKIAPITNKEEIKSYLKNLDIAYSRTLAGDNNSFALPNDWYEWMPTAHHKNPKIFEWIDEFNNYDGDTAYSANRVAKLFYVWGHSYEFENDNNWDRLEEICKSIGNREDTWYATNIEIYNYITAYNSLVFSADSTTIFNPTITTLWYYTGNKTYKIEPGKTVKIDQ